MFEEILEEWTVKDDYRIKNNPYYKRQVL